MKQYINNVLSKQQYRTIKNAQLQKKKTKKRK